jgi:hypothetical protein
VNELSMHILDIAENSTRAGATHVSIVISEDTRLGIMSISINDNGAGMTEEQVRHALDPFYTTKPERRTKIGLGLPLLKRTAEQCGGSLEIHSRPGDGTSVKMTMLLNHIDRPPMGDLNETLVVLIAGNPNVVFDVTYDVDGSTELFSTRDASDASQADSGESLKAAG